jgi:hypothetical protein
MGKKCDDVIAITAHLQGSNTGLSQMLPTMAGALHFCFRSQGANLKKQPVNIVSIKKLSLEIFLYVIYCPTLHSYNAYRLKRCGVGTIKQTANKKACQASSQVKKSRILKELVCHVNAA